MAHILIVHESEVTRSDLVHALEAEGFTTTQADSAAAAVREAWGGNFDGALIGQFGRVSGMPLDEHLRNLAPELVTLPINKEPAAKLARKLADILNGSSVAA